MSRLRIFGIDSCGGDGCGGGCWVVEVGWGGMCIVQMVG